MHEREGACYLLRVVDAAPPPPLLSMQAITKRFPGVLANDRVSFEVRAGEVHALLGENGAGKTTLMNILYGLYRPDGGEVHLHGRRVSFASPREARDAGIGLVAQHFHLARRHTVAENIALGLKGVPMWNPARAVRQQVRDLGERYGLPVDPDAKVWQLSPGEQQRVEILGALLQGAELLILDEPTSVLTPQEADALFEVVRRMTSEGKGVVFISHKLDEVMRVADGITVLRGGVVAGRTRREEADANRLAEMMMGRRVSTPRAERRGGASSDARAQRLAVHELHARGSRGADALRGLSFELYEGEILGVAGVAGNGQGELIDVLAGLHQPSRGRVVLDGSDITALGARGLLQAGVALIPEDRNHMGVVPAMSVAENLALRHYRSDRFSRGPVLDWSAVERFAEEAIEAYDIATPATSTPTRLLSGGNVQKLILARELEGEPRLVVASHPTYGLDVSAAAATHRSLLAQRDRGAGVLLVSEDLDELIKLADRILVLFEGRSMGVVAGDDADAHRIGLMMAGRDPDAAPSPGGIA